MFEGNNQKAWLSGIQPGGKLLFQTQLEWSVSLFSCLAAFMMRTCYLKPVLASGGGNNCIQNGFWKLICFSLYCHMKSTRFLKFLNHSLSNYILRTFGVLLLMIFKSTLFNVWNMYIYVYNHTYMSICVSHQTSLYVSRGRQDSCVLQKLLKLLHLFY